MPADVAIAEPMLVSLVVAEPLTILCCGV